MLLFKLLRFFTINTLWFNFKYFPFRVAIQFPVFVSSNVCLKKLKGKVIIEGEIETGMIRIGYGDIDIFDKRRSRSIWAVRGEVCFKGKALLGHGSKISVGENGSVIFGHNFRISAESSIISHKKIVFGDDCLLSWDVLIMDTDFHKILDGKGEILNSPLEILIGPKTWVGCRSLILKGAEVPPNSIIASCSIISSTLEKSNAIYGGYPLRIIKENINWID